MFLLPQKLPEFTLNLCLHQVLVDNAGIGVNNVGKNDCCWQDSVALEEGASVLPEDRHCGVGLCVVACPIEFISDNFTEE